MTLIVLKLKSIEARAVFADLIDFSLSPPSRNRQTIARGACETLGDRVCEKAPLYSRNRTLLQHPMGLNLSRVRPLRPAIEVSRREQCRHLATLYCMTAVTAGTSQLSTRCSYPRTSEQAICSRRPINMKVGQRRDLRRSVITYDAGHSSTIFQPTSFIDQRMGAKQVSRGLLGNGLGSWTYARSTLWGSRESVIFAMRLGSHWPHVGLNSRTNSALCFYVRSTPYIKPLGSSLGDMSSKKPNSTKCKAFELLTSTACSLCSWFLVF
jgi:hypothetical protein